MLKNFATRDGNDIVIRVPLERLEEILADADCVESQAMLTRRLRASA